MRHAPLAMTPDEFRSLGHRLVDRIAEHLRTLPERPVTHGEPPSQVRSALGGSRHLPDQGVGGAAALLEAADLLFDHSTFNGHPRFLAYITSSPAPLGMLGDFLAAAVNQNMGAWKLAPMATEIEAQTVRWIAELIEFPVNCGGLLVSGGNMANFVCFLAARAAKAGWDVRKNGFPADSCRLAVYTSAETHTWIQRPRIFSGSEPTRFGGCPSMPSNECFRRRCAVPSTTTDRAAFVPSWLSALPARWRPVRSIRCRSLQKSAASSICGFTSTVPMVGSPRRCPASPTACAG